MPDNDTDSNKAEYMPPPGWGEDSLSEFIDGATKNIHATFANLKPEYSRLKDINDLFGDVAEVLTNTKEWLESFFVLNARSYYLGAARFSMSGQVAESYVTMRGCLESALYGLHIYKTPDVRMIWLSRSHGQQERRACRDAFTFAKVRDYYFSL